VDRALEPQDSNVVIAVIFLVPDNQAYEPLEIVETMEFEVWGVVTSVIHNL
jgi:SOS-response transcriptional repressor LexA